MPQCNDTPSTIRGILHFVQDDGWAVSRLESKSPYSIYDALLSVKKYHFSWRFAPIHEAKLQFIFMKSTS
jgi:hypothetical protein